MDDKFAELFKELMDNMAHQKVNTHHFKFASEEDALHHASLIAQLQPGAILTYRLTEGLRKGAFVRLDEDCRCVMISVNPEDNRFSQACISPSGIIFEDMPAELVSPDQEDMDDDGLDDFPRT